MEQPGPGCGSLQWDENWMVSMVPPNPPNYVEFVLFPFGGERNVSGDSRVSSDAVTQEGKPC